MIFLHKNFIKITLKLHKNQSCFNYNHDWHETMVVERSGTPVAGTLQQSSFWHSIQFHLNEMLWQFLIQMWQSLNVDTLYLTCYISNTNHQNMARIMWYAMNTLRTWGGHLPWPASQTLLLSLPLSSLPTPSPCVAAGQSPCCSHCSNFHFPKRPCRWSYRLNETSSLTPWRL